ncbi:MAG: 16S rRNA (guanine(966)-N(2))-methyltransferase RsmD [Nitrospinae bacterium]|nr:16S rRNA (guanine(966)-N(2))-methyltransferase RsmD [Nitrospinota bacterium]
MRVTGGAYRGATLFTSKGLDVRPTPDKVKQAIFNILGEKVAGASFLDLFAGSGAMGLEAMSRGAARVTLVENRRMDLVERNLKKLRLEGSPAITLMKADVFQALAGLARGGYNFDIIYADPPWDAGYETRIVEEAAPVLSKGGALVMESSARHAPPGTEGGLPLRLTRSRKYGDTLVSFYASEDC